MAEIKKADASSVVRVLNGLGANVINSGQTIFYKTRKRSITRDLQEFAATYRPLFEMDLHHCGDDECHIENYYLLRININPELHQEAAGKLAELVNKYSKRHK